VKRTLRAAGGNACARRLHGDRKQESAKKEVGKTVKSDTLPWNNEPVAGGPKWTKGDRNSWEDQIKKRQLAQHEHKRIYQ
jgi:hypothetical protein